MSSEQAWQSLEAELQHREDQGAAVRLWLRDDDAVEPTPALQQLMTLTTAFSVPVAVAVIPGLSGDALAHYLADVPLAQPVAHGWTHANHAPPEQKHEELGDHRPLAAVQTDLSEALKRMTDLHGDRFVPMLVPPWNRIRSDILDHLEGMGFRALSSFADNHQEAPLPVLNTHVDLIDWHGTGGCRGHAALAGELLSQVSSGEPVGLLTHHLVHDGAAWDFLEKLLALTSRFPCVRWLSAAELIADKTR